MGPEEVNDKVLFFFRNNFFYGETTDEIGGDESLIDNGYIDSTGIIGLIAFIEKAFSINVRDQEIVPENFESLNNILAYVNKKVAVSNSAE